MTYNKRMPVLRSGTMVQTLKFVKYEASHAMQSHLLQCCPLVVVY